LQDRTETNLTFPFEYASNDITLPEDFKLKSHYK
jgi:hypothetical protein